MNFWKRHKVLRGMLVAVFFLAGVCLAFYGWCLTGQLSGLGWMLTGIFSLLISLLLYTKGF